MLGLRQALARCAHRVARRAARRYIAGPHLDDALRVVESLGRAGYATTIGFWDGPADTPQQVRQHYLADLAAIATGGLDCYESIKLPALREQPELLISVVDRAIERRIRLHFDSLAPEAADAMWFCAREAAGRGAMISASVPGRWRRSADDVEQALAYGIQVRVVKGQWADPEMPALDPREGFLRIVERLAGRAKRVAIATHDAPLGRQAVAILQERNTSCEWELLYGLPSRKPLAAALELDVDVRFYVPYGEAYLPYALAQARRQPRLLAQLAFDTCRGWFV